MAIKVVVFPNADNPYQELLYNGLKKNFNATIKRIVKSPAYELPFLTLPFRLLWLKLLNYRIFHLHWTYGFVVQRISYRIPRVFYSAYFYFILFYLKLLKYKIVWTVHEPMPHEKEFANDLSARKVLSRLADAKIVHSAFAINEMKNLGLDIDNTHIIPHGNYMSVYKNQVSKNEARKYLGLDKDDFIFLFFGIIRGYKGIENLLPAFKRLVKTRKNIKLVIAGDIAKDAKNLSKLIENYKKTLGQNLISNIGFIDDDKVQYYFNSADIVVLPFKKITTSGTAILALSFAKPVIAPKMACLNELPDNIGFFYKPDERGALYKAMEKAIKNKRKLKIMDKNAFEYAKSLSWDKISEKTYRLFKSLAGRGQNF